MNVKMSLVGNANIGMEIAAQD